MNEIPLACPVSCRVIRSEDLKRRTPTHGRVDGDRDEVCFRIVAFGKISACICSGSIEVPKARKPNAVSAANLCENPLASELGTAIGTNRLLSAFFGDR